MPYYLHCNKCRFQAWYVLVAKYGEPLGRVPWLLCYDHFREKVSELLENRTPYNYRVLSPIDRSSRKPFELLAKAKESL